MFERFTDKARHALVLSQEEARLLNHNYIGTEHILLGLLGEPGAIAGTVLETFGMTLDGVRAEVEEVIGRGKKAPGGHLPFTPRAKKVLELSLREALQIRHNYIGTEHILLGLIREGDGVAAQIMRRHENDLRKIRAAVIDAVPPGQSGEGAEETNAVLGWLRRRLTGWSAPTLTIPSRPGKLGAESATRGTPAAEAALTQAAALAGQSPIGSHHLLLAALADTNSAASWALASLGVNIDELREKLRSAPVEGTSDEQPEQAGRRQMSIQVTDEVLTLVLTDPVIVEAGKEALRVANARAARAVVAAKAARSAAEGPATEGPATEAEESASEEAVAKSVTATTIRGDLPAAAGLADVWLELRKTLVAIADPKAHARIRVAVKPKDIPSPGEPNEGDESGEGDGPNEGEAASS